MLSNQCINYSSWSLPQKLQYLYWRSIIYMYVCTLNTVYLCRESNAADDPLINYGIFCAWVLWSLVTSTSRFQNGNASYIHHGKVYNFLCDYHIPFVTYKIRQNTWSVKWWHCNYDPDLWAIQLLSLVQLMSTIFSPRPATKNWSVLHSLVTAHFLSELCKVLWPSTLTF